jgi:hypothetical protein
MLKYLILFIFVFLVTRAVVRMLWKGFLFIRKVRGSSSDQSSRAPFSSGGQIEEADYEVIESHLQNKEQEGG